MSSDHNRVTLTEGPHETSTAKFRGHNRGTKGYKRRQWYRNYRNIYENPPMNLYQQPSQDPYRQSFVGSLIDFAHENARRHAAAVQKPQLGSKPSKPTYRKF